MSDGHSEHKCAGKCHGRKLGIKLATMRCQMAALLALGIVFYLASMHSRMSPWTYWAFFIALALLGLSALKGSMLVEKSAHSLAVNNDWPLEAEVGYYAKCQKWLLVAAWVLIIAAVITAVYVRPGVRRPQPMMNQPGMQQNQRIQPGDRIRQQMMERSGQQPGQQFRPGQPGGPQPRQGPGANMPQPPAPGGQVPPGQTPPGQNPPGTQTPPKTGGK